MSEFKPKHFFITLAIAALGASVYANNKFGIRTTLDGIVSKLPF